MSLERYRDEARAHAQEILELISEEDLLQAQDFLHKHGTAGLLSMHPTERAAAEVFLGKTVAERQKVYQKLKSPVDRMLLLLRARYLAVQAANAIDVAIDVTAEIHFAGKYRAATRGVAQRIPHMRWLPTEMELIQMPQPFRWQRPEP